ncbi:MAG: flagellar biosynthetic protein FliP, partial [Armatimonadetes bacterium]|nr:flagellar biosynthetic protein FliP [Armatimonadota bacterium]
MPRSLLAPALLALLLLAVVPAAAQPPPRALGGLLPSPDRPADMAAALKLLVGLAVLSLAPALLIMLTCFTRIIIILGFLRSALGTQ